MEKQKPNYRVVLDSGQRDTYARSPEEALDHVCFLLNDMSGYPEYLKHIGNCVYPLIDLINAFPEVREEFLPQPIYETGKTRPVDIFVDRRRAYDFTDKAWNKFYERKGEKVKRANL